MWACSVMSDSLWPMNYGLPASSIHGIDQARILKWVAIPFSRGSSLPRDWTHISCWPVDSLPLSHQGSPKQKSRSIFWLCIGIVLIFEINSCVGKTTFFLALRKNLRKGVKICIYFHIIINTVNSINEPLRTKH